MREKSRAYPADGISFTESRVKQEDADIIKMDIFQIIEYIRAAIDIILEQVPSETQQSKPTP